MQVLRPCQTQYDNHSCRCTAGTKLGMQGLTVVKITLVASLADPRPGGTHPHLSAPYGSE